jgi:hypothetical protein
MNVSLDMSFLQSKGMTPDEFIVLSAIRNNIDYNAFTVVNINMALSSLEIDGYIRQKPDSEEYALTGAGLSIFEATPDVCVKFVEEYRNLFPKQLKSGNGTPIRGDRAGVVKKMTWFMTQYPEFSKQTILQVTKLYIEEMRRKGFQYMTQADYFIQKSGSSKLAAMCEDYRNKTTNIITTGEKRL